MTNRKREIRRLQQKIIMKKRLFIFLIASSLCTLRVNAAGLKPQRETKTLMERSAVIPVPRPKITDVIKNGFYEEGTKTRYYKNGRLHKGFLEAEGKRYYFDENGDQVTGQVEIEGAHYSFDPDGIMQTGSVQIRSKRYYYDPETGKQIFGPHRIGRHQYYFDKDTGAMVTGLLTRNSKGTAHHAYYNSQGHLETGTFRVSNVEYRASKKTGRIYSVKNLAKTICQRPELPTGCEITSWTMMAAYADIKIDKIQAADIMPSSPDPDQGFVGSPYSSSGGSLVIYPKGLASITKKYFGSFEDMTGCGLERLKEKLWDKHLVLIWVTRLDGFGSHTVALTGYDDGGFYYNDPWTGDGAKISNEELNIIWAENAYRAMSY